MKSALTYLLMAVFAVAGYGAGRHQRVSGPSRETCEAMWRQEFDESRTQFAKNDYRDPWEEGALVVDGKTKWLFHVVKPLDCQPWVEWYEWRKMPPKLKEYDAKVTQKRRDSAPNSEVFKHGWKDTRFEDGSLWEEFAPGKGPEGPKISIVPNDPPPTQKTSE